MMPSSTTDAELLAAAKTAAEQAYAPYSDFRVGAALLADDGTIYTGANVENAAYPSGMCAEAVAIGTAVAGGVRKIEAVATACLDGPGCTPCGQCRQRMSEFGVERVILEAADGGIDVHSFAEILPGHFGREHLES
jgi:cytidine deaminase